MARRKNNAITNGHSGKVGNMVFTSDNNVRKTPDNSKRVLSPKQKKHLSKFQMDKEYGRMAIRDPELNSYYAEKARKRKGKGAWHMAIKDYFQLPAISEIDFNGFRGLAGDIIAIQADGMFKLRAVEVNIKTAEGDLLETGFGGDHRMNIGKLYILQHDLPSGEVYLTVRAFNLPGHFIERRIAISASSNGIQKFPDDPEYEIRRVSRLKSQLRR
jgi:hypothetical protein